MAVVVSDTSPIRALAFLERLSLLRDLFGHVLIPSAVQNELASPQPRFGVIDVTLYDFIEVRSPHDDDRVRGLLAKLDRGESEALALALETDTRLILIDELRGRKTAAQYGLTAVGTLGVLLRAKSRGLISAVRPLIEKLDELEFFMSDQLKNDILRLAGE